MEEELTGMIGDRTTTARSTSAGTALSSTSTVSPNVASEEPRHV